MPLTKACPCVIVVPVGASLEGATIAHTLSSFPLWFTHITIVESDALGSVVGLQEPLEECSSQEIPNGRVGDFAEKFPEEILEFWNKAGLLPVALTSSPGRDGPINNASLVASTFDRTNALHLSIQDKLKRPQNLKLISNANSAVSGDSIASSLVATQNSEGGLDMEDSMAASLRLGSRGPSTNFTTRTNTFVEELEGGTSRRLEGGSSVDYPQTGAGEMEEGEDQHQRMEIDMEHASISFGVSGYTQKFQYLFFVGDSPVAARFAKTFPSKVFHFAPQTSTVVGGEDSAESPSRNEAVITHSPSKVTLRHGRVDGAGTPPAVDDGGQDTVNGARLGTSRRSRSNLSSMRIFPVKTCSLMLERFSIDGKPSKAADFLHVLSESIEEISEKMLEKKEEEEMKSSSCTAGQGASPSPDRGNHQQLGGGGGLASLEWPTVVAVGTGIVIFAFLIKKLL